jgi:hypothetical protein
MNQNFTTYWKFHFKVLLSSVTVFRFHLPFRFSGKFVLLIDYIHLYYMSCSSHTSWFDQLTYVFCR